MGAKDRFKVWTASPESGTGMMVTEDTALVVGNQKNFMSASPLGISLVTNSLVFGTLSENIRTGGMFVQMSDFVRMVPSCIATPRPEEVPFPPMALFTGIIKHIPVVLKASATTEV
jgi:hypothetical protein